ncbi:MAG: TetR family transcriptional regulator [Caulobacter sp.]|nr:TetR family transcriptional regulator [Caulobacter sp.]
MGKQGVTGTRPKSTDRKPAAERTPAKPRTRGRPGLRAEAVDRQNVILDAAEALFSVHGFYGVTVRQVATEAGVDSSLLGYYFNSKRGLFEAVLNRRAEIANANRLMSMARYEAETEILTVEGCLGAFFEPVLERWETGGPGWRNYLRLVALVNNTPAWGGDTMTRFFDPVINMLIGMLRKAVPDARDEDLYWSYHFVSGALSLSFAETGRIDHLSGGLCRSADVQAVRERMAAFLAPGFLELSRRAMARNS